MFLIGVAVALVTSPRPARCEGSERGAEAARPRTPSSVTGALGGKEELLTGAMVQQTFDKTRTQQHALSLGDLSRQVRHACQAEVDLDAKYKGGLVF